MTTLSIYAYGALPADPVQAKAKIGGFCEVLGVLPLWALKIACQQWRRDETEAPTPAALRALAEHHMGKFARVKLPPVEEYGQIHHRTVSADVAVAKLVGWLNEGKKTM